MISLLVDSNICLRILQPEHPQHQTALGAVRTLARSKVKLYVVPQNLVETWAVVTRPILVNGLGMSTQQAVHALGRLKDLFTVLTEREETFAIWESLVAAHRVSGKAAHDARIVAAMKVHGLNSILTFNTGDFTRFPGIQVLHPADIARTPAS